MKEIKYAPVIIPTLCRHEHFKNGIESLKKNGWAKYTDVYIALDYPAKEAHWDGYKKICEYLENGDFSVFKSFTVFKREKNCGAVDNTKRLYDDVMDSYDRYIYAEDDLVFSPNFLEYTDKCLAMYEDDDDVIAVNGYSYPLDWKTDKDANVIFQSSVCATWGVAYWKNKNARNFPLISSGYLVKEFEGAYKNEKLGKMIRHRRYDYIGAVLGGREESLIDQITDFSVGIYAELENKYIVTPHISKVRNMGFDGSGLYCDKIENTDDKNSLDFDYANQSIDELQGFEPVPDSFMYRDENKKLLDDFLRIEFKYVAAAKILAALYRILGMKRYVATMKTVCSFFARLNIKYFDNVTFKYLAKEKR